MCSSKFKLLRQVYAILFHVGNCFREILKHWTHENSEAVTRQ